MRRVIAIALLAAAGPNGASGQSESDALNTCAAMTVARYSDALSSQVSYAIIQNTVEAMPGVASQAAGNTGAAKIEASFRERSEEVRERLGPLSPSHAGAGEMPDWAHHEFDRCDNVISRRGDKIAAYHIQKLKVQ